MNFNYVYKKRNKIINTNIPGEMIDVSIPHKTSIGIIDLYANKTEFIHTINFENINENQVKLICDKFPMTTFTLSYFCKDLETMLFYKFDKPWLLEKYKKRIIRLLFLYFVDLQKKINNLEETQNYVNMMETVYSLENKIKYKEHIGKIKDFLLHKKSKNLENTLINNFDNFTLNLLEKDQSVFDDVNYTEYIEIINKFCKDMSNIYQTFDTTLNVTKLNIIDERMNIINMVGGHYKSIPFEYFLNI